MIWMISSMVMASLLILCGIFINYAPPVQNIVESDFLRKATYNARLEGLNYADVCLRANTLKPDSAVPSENTKVINNDLYKKDSITKQKTTATITTIPPGETQNFEVQVTTAVETLYN